MNTAQRWLIIVLGVLVVGSACLCLGLSLAAGAAARETRALQDTLEQTKRQAQEVARAQASSRKLATQIAAHPDTWSWSEQLPVMVTQISGLTQQCGVKIDTLQPNPSVEKAGLVRYPLRLTLQTHLDGLTHLLQRAQQARPVLAVDQLSVRNSVKPGDPLQVTLTLSSYQVVSGRPAVGGQP